MWIRVRGRAARRARAPGRRRRARARHGRSPRPPRRRAAPTISSTALALCARGPGARRAGDAPAHVGAPGACSATSRCSPSRAASSSSAPSTARSPRASRAWGAWPSPRQIAAAILARATRARSRRAPHRRHRRPHGRRLRSGALPRQPIDRQDGLRRRRARRRPRRRGHADRRPGHARRTPSRRAPRRRPQRARDARRALGSRSGPISHGADALIMSAAVADYRPAQEHATKMKRDARRARARARAQPGSARRDRRRARPDRSAGPRRLRGRDRHRRSRRRRGAQQAREEARRPRRRQPRRERLLRQGRQPRHAGGPRQAPTRSARSPSATRRSDPRPRRDAGTADERRGDASGAAPPEPDRTRQSEGPGAAASPLREQRSDERLRRRHPRHRHRDHATPSIPAARRDAAMLIAIGRFYALSSPPSRSAASRQRGELRRRSSPGRRRLHPRRRRRRRALRRRAPRRPCPSRTHRSSARSVDHALYLQLGDPAAPGRALVGGAVFVIAALEELVWRGLVMRALEASRRAPRAGDHLDPLRAGAPPTLFLLATRGGPEPARRPRRARLRHGRWGLVVLRTAASSRRSSRTRSSAGPSSSSRSGAPDVTRSSGRARRGNRKTGRQEDERNIGRLLGFTPDRRAGVPAWRRSKCRFLSSCLPVALRTLRSARA